MGGKNSHRLDRSHNELKIISLNARSLLPKIESLQLLVAAEDLYVICVVETWLSAEILDAEISIQGYQCFRRDRNRHGGGIVVYVRDCLSTTPIMDNVDLELLILSLTVNNRKTTIGTFYRPPNSSSELMDALYTCLENLDITCFTHFILLGDFNINFCNTSHHHFCKLSNLMHVFSLTQVVKDPTHHSPSGHSSIIDLILVSDLQNVRECTVMPPLANSDHNSVFLQVKMKGTKDKVKSTHRCYWRYDLADLDKARERIEDTDWNTLLKNDDIKRLLDKLEKQVL